MVTPLGSKLNQTLRELKETDKFSKKLYRRSKFSLSRLNMGDISESRDVDPNGEMPNSPKLQFYNQKLHIVPLFLIFYEVSGGPFGVEDSVKAGGPLLALLGFLIFPIIWSIPEALVTAEMATMFPENGGYVVWISAAFGPFWGFQQGWWKWLSGVILLGMGERGLLPALFAVRSSYGTPLLGILFSASGVLFLSSMSFQEIVAAENYLYCFGMFAEFAAFIWLRFKQPAMSRPYKVPLGTLGAILLCLPPSLLLILVVAVASLKVMAVSITAVMIGFILCPCLDILNKKKWVKFATCSEFPDLSDDENLAPGAPHGSTVPDSEVGLLSAENT